MQLPLAQRNGTAEQTHPLVTEMEDPHSLQEQFPEHDFLIITSE